MSYSALEKPAKPHVYRHRTGNRRWQHLFQHFLTSTCRQMRREILFAGSIHFGRRLFFVLREKKNNCLLVALFPVIVSYIKGKAKQRKTTFKTELLLLAVVVIVPHECLKVWSYIPQFLHTNKPFTKKKQQ